MRANPLQEMLREALCDPADVGLAFLAEVRKTPGPGTVTAWTALLADTSLCHAFVAAILRSGALEGKVDPRRRLIVEDLIAALGRLPSDDSRELLVRLWERTAVPGDLRVAAGDALLNHGDPSSHQALASSLDREIGPALNLSLRGLFALDCASAYDQIAPRLEPPGEKAATLLQAVLRFLMNDILESRKRASAEPSLFARDPRWKDLCTPWKNEPSPELVKRWGDAAHTIHEIASWLCES